MKTSHGGNAPAAARALERQIWSLVRDKHMNDAIAACRQLNRDHADYAPGWHTTSQIAMQTGNAAAALAAIEAALRIEPDETLWLLQEVLCLGALGRTVELRDKVDALQSRSLETPYQLSALALSLTQLGDRGAALDLYQRAASLEPHVAKHRYNVACLQRTLGHLEDAETSFDKAIELDPDDFESLKIRSELRRQTPARNHVSALEQLLANGVEDSRGQVQICYALAKELEDLGEYDRSFRILNDGAKLRRSQMRYDVQRDVATMQTIRQTFDADLFSEKSGSCDSREAIFVLGLPRTGTTLVERILASHSDVFAAGELNNFSIQLMGLAQAYSGGKKIDRDTLVRQCATLDFERLGKAYIESTRPFTGHTARFVDKMPLNFLYVGLIHLALPNARIVLLERDPMDTCYAIYKQLFIDAYPFSYSLAELGEYFIGYRKLVEHWESVLPDVVYTVSYETLVSDTETEVRRLLDYCGLGWQDACLSFHESKEASATASTAQIRQPVYTSSVGKWRRYREQLDELANLLSNAGISIPERDGDRGGR